jgi:fatty-acyl-CoA synthase
MSSTEMTDGPTPATFVHWMLATAGHAAGHIALIDVDGSTLSYAQMRERIIAVANALIDAGAQRGRPLCLAMIPSSKYLVTMLGGLLAGAVVAPLNTRLTGPELSAYLDRLQPGLVVHDDTHRELVLAALGPDRQELARSAEGLRTDRSPPDASELLATIREGDPAIIFPTGGTTGLPKGAYTDHRRLQMWVWNVALSTRRHRHEVELYFSPFFHVSVVVGLFAPLFAGGTVVIDGSFDAGRSAQLIQRWGINRLLGAPTMFTALSSHPEMTPPVRSQIRSITFGSTAATSTFVARLLEDFPNAVIGYGYGATEFGSGVSRADDADLRSGRIDGVGRANPGCTIRIVDSEGNDVMPGEVGEVIVRSPWQTIGYWNQPDETARTYRSDGFIMLGDLGRFDETGWLHIVGRTKEMIISGGENVYPSEVERAINGLASVREVVVFGVADEYWGERVEAVVTAAPGTSPDPDDLRRQLRDHLAGYKIPKRIHIIDQIPLTPNNKPDRRALTASYSASR